MNEPPSRVAHLGHWLRNHTRLIGVIRASVVLIYLTLILLPLFLPEPTYQATFLNNATRFAQFAFWGLWWPLVLVSIVLFGRSWCGFFCPEGTLTQWASRHGQGRPIARWLRWPGWPFVAFMLTTIYGQLTSVYQYPKPAALVLGGSTVAAMAVGWRYGKNRRVWCRYLCPVTGVFRLLAKIAPWHYRVDVDAWRSPDPKAPQAHCAPLLPLRHMQSASDCHMCAGCSGHRGAISLSTRSPEHEILTGLENQPWHTHLLTWGLLGLVPGAFTWSQSTFLVQLKTTLAGWLIDHHIFWPLQANAPWYVLTHYPHANDTLNWLDGALLLGYGMTTTILVGGSAWLALHLAGFWLSAKKRTQPAAHALHDRLALALIPLAAAGVFGGLFATTLTLLHQGGLVTGPWIWLRQAIFVAASLWSFSLVWRIAARAGATALWTRAGMSLTVLLGLIPYGYWMIPFFF